MIQIYTYKDGDYICHGEFEDYTSDKYLKKIRSLLEHYRPEDIITCEHDLIKKQLMRTVDGI